MNSLNNPYRPWIWPWFKHWLSPSTYYYWAKYKIQRANRGWADCDVWSLDNYLSEWLPAALRRLQDNKPGVPCIMFEDTYINHTEEEFDAAKAKWNSILQKIIDGFEALNRANAFDYDAELGPHPPVPDDPDAWLYQINNPTPEQKERRKAMMELIKRDEKTFEEGMALFAKHFRSLWD